MSNSINFPQVIPSSTNFEALGATGATNIDVLNNYLPEDRPLLRNDRPIAERSLSKVPDLISQIILNGKPLEKVKPNLQTEVIESAEEFCDRVTNENNFAKILPLAEDTLYRVSGLIKITPITQEIYLPQYLYLDTNRFEMHNILNKQLDMYVKTSGPCCLTKNKNLTTLESCCLSIGGFFNASNNLQLRHLPSHMILEDSLILENCFQLQNLPNQSRVRGLLNINNCYSITKLPKNLTVRGNLKAENSGLTNLYDSSLKVTGDVLFNSCKNLEQFPENFSVDGSLYSKNTYSLLQPLTETLNVGKNIYFDDSAISAFPSGWTLQGDILSLKGCYNLEELTKDQHSFKDKRVISAKLFMQSCVKLHKLPEELIVGKSKLLSPETSPVAKTGFGLKLKSNRSSVSVGSTSEITASSLIGSIVFDISSCSNIEKLPPFLTVYGSFHAQRAVKLKTLSQNMLIYGNANFSGCINFSSFPEGCIFGNVKDAEGRNGIFINGDIDFSNCSSLTEFPKNFFKIGYKSDGNVRVINLENSGVCKNKAYFSRLKQEAEENKYHGLRFIFSTNAVEKAHNFISIEEVVNFWEDLSGNNYSPVDVGSLVRMDIGFVRITEYEEQNIKERHSILIKQLTNFLSNLTGTADYKDENSRQHLANSVITILNKITLLNTKNKIHAFNSLVATTDSCGDRVSKGLDDLSMVVETCYIIQTAERTKNIALIEELAITTKIWETIDKTIIKYITSKSTVGFIDEVQEAIKIRRVLCKQFNIYLATLHFSDIDQASVDQEFIDSAIKKIKTEIMTPEGKAKVIQESHIYQSFNRFLSLPEHKNLLVYSVNEIKCCAITNELDKKMVVDTSHPSEIIFYTYATFVNIYRETGISPHNRQKIDLANIHRPEIADNTPRYERLLTKYVSGIYPCIISGQKTAEMVAFKDSPTEHYVFSELVKYIENNHQKPFSDEICEAHELNNVLVKLDQRDDVPPYNQLETFEVDNMEACYLTGAEPFNNNMVREKGNIYAHYTYDAFISDLISRDKLATFDFTTLQRLVHKKESKAVL